MTNISKRQLDKLIRDGKVKPTEKTAKTHQNKQIAKDVARTAAGVENTLKSINAAGTEISKSVLELVNVNKPVESKKKKWEFTMHRNSEGFLETITAMEL